MEAETELYRHDWTRALHGTTYSAERRSAQVGRLRNQASSGRPELRQLEDALDDRAGRNNEAGGREGWSLDSRSAGAFVSDPARAWWRASRCGAAGDNQLTTKSTRISCSASALGLGVPPAVTATLRCAGCSD